MNVQESQATMARERIARLFRFLAAMQQLSSPPALQIKGYSFKFRVADIPASKYVTFGRIGTSEEDAGDDFILKVKKPPDKKDPASTFFDRLLELNNTIERESERVELVLGDGILRQDHLEIEHPVLLQKLQLEFVAENAEILLRETDRECELYSPVLRRLGVSEAAINEARNHLQAAAVHPLGGDETSQFLNQLFQDLFQPGPDVPTIRRDSIIFLGPRSAAFTQAIDAFLEALPTMEELPPSLLRVVGLEPGMPPAPEEIDLLLTMPSNPEQDRVARRLATTGAVLVQGPPGTGKTHTIANLIGHLLAQGKSILVTSHASKALRIVRDMVPPELRALCVSVLEQESESRDQLEAAVKGIVNRFTTSDPEEMEGLAAEYAERRSELRERLEGLEKKLLEARADEYRPLQVGEETLSPARAAQLLIDATAAVHAWLPGPLKCGEALPLTNEEVRTLYRYNREVPAELELDLSDTLPPPDKLISEFDFRQVVAKKKQLQTGEHFGEEFWEHDAQEPKVLQRLVDQIERSVGFIDESSPWTLDCMRVGMLGGAHRQMWEDLVGTIEGSVHEFTELERKVLATGAEIPVDVNPSEQIRITREIIEYLKTKGSIGRWTFITPSWSKILSNAKIHSARSPKSLEEVEGVLAYLLLGQARQILQTRWDRQMAAKGAPSFASIGDRPQEECFSYVGHIKAALDWYDTEWESCRRLFKELGLRWSAMVDRVPINPGIYGELFRIKEAVKKYLIPTIQSRRGDLDASVYDIKLRQQEAVLAECASKDLGGIVSKLRAATAALDADAYARAWAWFMQLQTMQEPAQRRNDLLKRLEPLAPTWAQAIRGHRQPHDRNEPPGDAVIAWKFRQWTQQLEERSESDPDQLQHEIQHLKSQLRLATAQYVENRTWANQLRRTGVRQQQALVGWLDLMRKIGSGKGKRAPRLKATAREKLAECRDAVPVWIMPLARVAESYHPGESNFDVVILDEASQCDVTGLMAFALGKEVLVVGDNEQVSPEAVGMSYEKVEALIEEHLYDIPNKELYDGKTSVYDLARQSFGGTIRLVEHFRCVTEIIAFSNKLCYQGEIQPLREHSKVRLRPPTLFHKVKGGQYLRKINKAEVEEVASLVIACCEQPEYKGQTFGVISMVGEEQALAIEKLLTAHLSLTEYQERRMLCGNAAQFQGDERDVMFLTMVETPEDSGALALRRTEVFTKRFNVAASRARNQMWVVSSLDPDIDLKPGDLREALIQHAANPSRTVAALAEMQTHARPSSDSNEAGEHRVARMLQERLGEKGFHVTPNFLVGSYVLDLVVEGKGGRVAIKCDGDQENAPERFKLAVEREAVLERLGWRFIRLRASQFFLRPEFTIQQVLRRLEVLGLEPWPATDGTHSEEEGQDLYRRVLQRAAQVRRSWTGESEPEEFSQQEPQGDVHEQLLAMEAAVEEIRPEPEIVPHMDVQHIEIPIELVPEPQIEFGEPVSEIVETHFIPELVEPELAVEPEPEVRSNALALAFEPAVSQPIQLDHEELHEHDDRMAEVGADSEVVSEHEPVEPVHADLEVEAGEEVSVTLFDSAEAPLSGLEASQRLAERLASLSAVVEGETPEKEDASPELSSSLPPLLDLIRNTPGPLPLPGNSGELEGAPRIAHAGFPPLKPPERNLPLGLDLNLETKRDENNKGMKGGGGPAGWRDLLSLTRATPSGEIPKPLPPLPKLDKEEKPEENS